MESIPTRGLTQIPLDLEMMSPLTLTTIITITMRLNPHMSLRITGIPVSMGVQVTVAAGTAVVLAAVEVSMVVVTADIIESQDSRSLASRAA
jgi:hypothetical protein